MYCLGSVCQGCLMCSDTKRDIQQVIYCNLELNGEMKCGDVQNWMAGVIQSTYLLQSLELLAASLDFWTRAVK